ncbi:hypothetical protein A9Q99_23960 [Gammaproteobacteria bacterium 45_16_T64]|nr:hypothetical protein A9Q99_23960 [Gammaproteobacteria bacterium 45_16_T64]
MIIKKRNLTILSGACLIAACSSYSLLWEAELLGGSNNERLYTKGVLLDSEQNRIVIGAETNFWGETEEGEPLYGFDPLVAKYDKNGKLLWRTTLDTPFERTARASSEGWGSHVVGEERYPGGEEAHRVVIDGDDDIYILAATLGENFNQTSGSQSDWDRVLAKYSRSGALLWTVTFTDEYENIPFDIALLDSGIAVVGMPHDDADNYPATTITVFDDDTAEVIAETILEGITTDVVASQSDTLAISGYETVTQLNGVAEVQWQQELATIVTVPDGVILPLCSGSWSGDKKAAALSYDSQGGLYIALNSNPPLFCGFYTITGTTDIYKLDASTGEFNWKSTLAKDVPADSQLEAVVEGRRFIPFSMDWLGFDGKIIADEEGVYFAESMMVIEYYAQFVQNLRADILVSRLDSAGADVWQKRIKNSSQVVYEDSEVVDTVNTLNRLVAVNADQDGGVNIELVAAGFDGPTTQNSDGLGVLQSMTSKGVHYDRDGKRATISTTDNAVSRGAVMSSNNDYVQVMDDFYPVYGENEDVLIYKRFLGVEDAPSRIIIKNHTQ